MANYLLVCTARKATIFHCRHQGSFSTWWYFSPFYAKTELLNIPRHSTVASNRWMRFTSFIVGRLVRIPMSRIRGSFLSNTGVLPPKKIALLELGALRNIREQSLRSLDQDTISSCISYHKKSRFFLLKYMFIIYNYCYVFSQSNLLLSLITFFLFFGKAN